MDARGGRAARRQDRLGSVSRPGTAEALAALGAPPRSERPGAAGGPGAMAGPWGPRCVPLYFGPPMESKFEPAEVEPRWRLRWEELEVGRADATSDRPSFTIARRLQHHRPAAHGPRHGGLGPGHSGPPLADARVPRSSGVPGTDHAATPPMR